MAMPSHPVRPGGLSEADRASIFELAQRGWKPGPIARRIEKHPATVRWFMYRNGLARPTGSNGMPTDRPNAAGRRGYRPEEDAFILGLRCQNVDLGEIARQATERFGHKRTRHGVEVRLVMLAARDDAEAA